MYKSKKKLQEAHIQKHNSKPTQEIALLLSYSKFKHGVKYFAAGMAGCYLSEEIICDRE